MVVQAVTNFSTWDVPAQDQFESWRNVMAPVVEMELLDPTIKAFEAELNIWNLGGLTLTRATMPNAARRWRHLNREPLDHWCLVLAQNKATGHGTDQRYLGFRSLARPFEGLAEDTHVLTLFIPRDLFGGTESALDMMEGDIPDIGIGAIVADYLLMLEKRLPQVDISEWPSIVTATRSLIAACLTPTLDKTAEAQPVINRTVMQRARDVIQRRIGQPEFGAAQLCREVGVSRSKLYRLFEPLGGITHYIQRQRLLHVHSELSYVGNFDSINRIADRFGFPDASGFSRAFRKEFGYTPSEARAAALSSFPLTPGPARIFRAPRARESFLGEILRSLHA